MKTYGPPSLISVGGKKILDHQIEAIEKRIKNFEIVYVLALTVTR